MTDFDRMPSTGYEDYYLKNVVRHTILFPPEIEQRISALMRGSLLDVGTADGSKLLHLMGANHARVDHVTLVEPSDLIELAKANLSEHRVTAYQQTIEQFEGEETFDLILALEVIEHLENPKHVIAKMKHLLKPGGTIVISTPNKFIYHLSERLRLGQIDPTHVSEMSLREFRKLFDGHFDSEYMGSLPLMDLLRKSPLVKRSHRHLAWLPLCRTLFCFGKVSTPADGDDPPS